MDEDQKLKAVEQRMKDKTQHIEYTKNKVSVFNERFFLSF